MRLSQHHQTKLALGGDVTLTLVTDLSQNETKHLFSILWRRVYQFEKQFSRFLPMSELSMFNRSAGLKTPITPGFRELLLAAQDQSQTTDGLYNPFILPALQRAGYKNSALPGYENDAVDDHSSKRVVTIDKLKIGDSWASIPYGTALDMGGCGKGYLADQLAKLLHSPRIYGFWLSLGGDIATYGHDENGHNWTVNIQDANNLAGELDWVIECPKRPFAVASSGTFRRPNQSSGQNWHHIISPITLRPVLTDIRLATVCSDTALSADVLASCAVILGSQKAHGFLKTHGIGAALLQCKYRDEKGASFEKKFGHFIQKQSSRVVNGAGQHA